MHDRRVLKPRLLNGHSKMKDRLLFHLRPDDGPTSTLEGASKSLSAPPKGVPTTPDKVPDSPTTTIEEPRLLTSTCIHSSSPSSVTVGFKEGVVHVYHREDGEGNGRPGCEEEGWKRSVLHPTRALLTNSSEPSVVAPDITCVALSPAGDMLAAGTSDGFVFVSKVSHGWCCAVWVNGRSHCSCIDSWVPASTTSAVAGTSLFPSRFSCDLKSVLIATM